MAKPPRKKTGKRVSRFKKTASHRVAKPSPPNEATVVLLNKPFGYISQFSGDDHTLADLVPVQGVYPAGRLDKDSEGLLLLTNHGSLQHRISHPKRKWLKHYWVQVEGVVTDLALEQLRSGVALKDGRASAVSVRQIDPPDLWPRNPPVRHRLSVPDTWIDLTLDEGRNRQVRRMTAAVGLPTLRLIRHRIGDWDLGDIKSGKYQTNRLSGTKLQQLLI